MATTNDGGNGFQTIGYAVDGPWKGQAWLPSPERQVGAAIQCCGYGDDAGDPPVFYVNRASLVLTRRDPARDDSLAPLLAPAEGALVALYSVTQRAYDFTPPTAEEIAEAGPAILGLLGWDGALRWPVRVLD